MNNEPSRFKNILKISIIAVFFAVIMLPMILIAAVGPDTENLENEAETEVKELSASSWLDTSFQKTFETWFSGDYSTVHFR